MLEWSEMLKKTAAAAQDDFLGGLPMRAGMASGKAHRVGGRSLPCGCSDGPTASRQAPREDALSSLTFQFSHRPYHVMSLSNQRRASSARCARVAGPRRSCTPLPRLRASARYFRARTQGVGLPRARRPAAHRGARRGRSCRDVEAQRALRGGSLEPLCSLLWRDCTSSPRGLGAELFGDFSEIPAHHLLRPPLQAKPRPHLPSRRRLPGILFAPGHLVDPVGAPAFDRPDPNLDFRGAWLCARCCAEQLCHFGVRVGEVRRHLRGSVLPSVGLAQDGSQHEVPLPPPARSGCYAAQRGLLDGADDALREVGVAPGSSLNSPDVVADETQARVPQSDVAKVCFSSWWFALYCQPWLVNGRRNERRQAG